jgi:hypothetical protein
LREWRLNLKIKKITMIKMKNIGDLIYYLYIKKWLGVKLTLIIRCIIYRLKNNKIKLKNICNVINYLNKNKRLVRNFGESICTLTSRGELDCFLNLIKWTNFMRMSFFFSVEFTCKCEDSNDTIQSPFLQH